MHEINELRLKNENCSFHDGCLFKRHTFLLIFYKKKNVAGFVILTGFLAFLRKISSCATSFNVILQVNKDDLLFYSMKGLFLSFQSVSRCLEQRFHFGDRAT